MVDVDELLADGSVSFLEVEAADGTAVSVVSEAGATCGGAVLVAKNDNGSQRTVTDTNASESKKFYRVEIVKP